ncbi:MAG TPA: serine hydrolase [Streptosporangiaceae bacterium]
MRRAHLPLAALFAAVLSGCTSTPAAPAPPVSTPAQVAQSTKCPAPVAAPKVTPADVRFTPGRTLRSGSARDAGLTPGPVAAIASDAARFMKQRRYPGAVVLAARNGVIATHEAMGYALRYSDDKPTELPRDRRIPMRKDTIFDIASLSKLFTSLVAVQQVERGTLSLNAPVASYLPGFGQRCKDHITVRQLLTHTSGLRPDLPFYRDKTRAQQQALLYSDKPQATPGTAYIYSDLNLIVLQFVLEKVTGRTLDALVRDGITRPLGMTDTGYRPPAAHRSRIAATEDEHVPPAKANRGLVWGQVHDENAWALGGVAGHAGVFSTAHDLAILAQMLLNGGRYGQVRVLSEDSTRWLFTDFNRKFPGNSHALGFELNQRRYMDQLASPVTAGHTGYTGTALVINPRSHAFVILLTNRVHPSRLWGGINPARRAVARDLAQAIA